MGRSAALRLLNDARIACVADASHLGPWRSQRDPQDFCHGLLAGVDGAELLALRRVGVGE